MFYSSKWHISRQKQKQASSLRKPYCTPRRYTWGDIGAAGVDAVITVLIYIVQIGRPLQRLRPLSLEVAADLTEFNKLQRVVQKYLESDESSLANKM